MLKTSLRLLRPLQPMSQPLRKPLVTIIGATGTGKSQLAVELAKKFDGEVINSDSLQLYRGLPIITNKVTEEEKQGVAHHLLDCIGIEQQPWRVDKYVSEALRVINDIHERGRLPILVGGTHYYMHSLLFKDALTDPSVDEALDGKNADGHDPVSNALLDTEDLDSWSTQELYNKLMEVDPVMAERWHPNDTRKIKRSLQIYMQTGKKTSEVYAEQKTKRLPDHPRDETVTEDSGLLGDSRLRFPTLLLWIHADRDTLNDRLRARVDKMVEQGLLDEVLDLHVKTKGNTLIDFGRGIFIAVGYRQYSAFLRAFDALSPPPNLEAGLSLPERLTNLAHEGHELTKIATFQYSRAQVKWIRNRLANALRDVDELRSLIALDGSDLESWEDNVLAPAQRYVRAFLDLEVLPSSPLSLESLGAGTTGPQVYERRTCEVCGVVATTQAEWEKHAQSKKHKIKSRRLSRQMEDNAGLGSEAGRG